MLAVDMTVDVGFDGYLAKPVDPVELAKCVQRLTLEEHQRLPPGRWARIMWIPYRMHETRGRFAERGCFL